MSHALNVGSHHPDDVVNRGFQMDEVSKISKTTIKIAHKVLESIVAILVTTGICTIMAIAISGFHPIVMPIAIIMGLWQGILSTHKIWEE
ncbi:MAG: hypothetical protein FJZ62_06330 [Chlamydiae bacterium]|nr:hypothetical protein [Chlamydiota bacterium]